MQNILVVLVVLALIGAGVASYALSQLLIGWANILHRRIHTS